MLSLFAKRAISRARNARPFASRSLASIATADSALKYQGASFPYIWLRDSCQCTSCIHPSNKQKLHRTSDIPLDVTPGPDGVKVTDRGVEVTWKTDGHTSVYSPQFLDRHSSEEKLSNFHKDALPVAWDLAGVQKARDLFLPYEALQSPSGLLAAITQLTQYGLLFLRDVPNLETGHVNCEVRKLAERFGGQIRSTMYGELWDVINIRNSTNIAYTDLDLGLHMDLLYFEHPPRYQVLHCLRNRVIGGKSLFVDALHAASTLRASNPAFFSVLATTPVAFHYATDGHHMHRSHTTVEMDTASGSSLATQTIKCINYSPPFQAPLSLSTTPPEFYAALQEFAGLLAKPEAEYEYQLQEGDAVVFDNRRVLHARSAFKDREDQEGVGAAIGETNRWLKGCYFEADTFLDRGRVLRAEAAANEVD